MIQVPLAEKCFALIDDEDTPLLAFRWNLNRAGYAVRVDDGLQLHRAVLHAPEGIIVDHKNGDKVDCRRSNLRLVTPLINARNFAERKRKDGRVGAGVHWHKLRGKWTSCIRVNGRLIHLGLYTDFDEALRVRAEAEVELWGVEPRRKEALERALGRTLVEQMSDGLQSRKSDGR